FCLLDEVDAPLDEANIGRFNQLVRDMATTSQFVLITHNRRTMEVADTLYGITMERAGISKVVAVRLREAAKATSIPVAQSSWLLLPVLVGFGVLCALVVVWALRRRRPTAPPAVADAATV